MYMNNEELILIRQDTDKIFLENLRENYRNINHAFWECHKIYWQMISFFLPIVLSIMVFVLKDTENAKVSDNKVIQITFFTGILILLTFWFLTTQYLHSWNESRRKRLKKIEEYFNSLKLSHYISEGKDIESFNQYRLAYRGGFNNLTCLLYVFLVMGTLIIMHQSLAQVSI